MKTRNHSLRRVFASALAVTTAAAIVIAGTYGWSAISQIAKGTADGTTQNGGGENQTGPGGRLHFDFDRESGAAEVYAENFGTEPLFVRARLNVTTDLDPSEVTYSYGGDKIFMPTFLKDSTKLYSDVTGDAIDPLREDAPVPEYPDYTENQTYTTTAYYTDQTNALATHKAKSTLTGSAPAPIADWDGDPVDRWFRDADGWYYWGAPLEAGEATSLLLNAIELKADRDDWEFVILPEAEFTTFDDVAEFTSTSPEADKLLEGIVPEIIESGMLAKIGRYDTSGNTFWLAHDVNSEILKRQVLTVTVVNEIDLTDAVRSWDVSAAKDNSVMAWYTGTSETNAQGEPMYNVFLGADGKVKTGEDASGLFSYFDRAVSMDVCELDTSYATNFDFMFYYATNITSLNISGWNTSNVTTMGNMFQDANKLTSLDLSGWDTSNVTIMRSLFWRAYALADLDLSGWDTSDVTIMSSMFADAYRLTSLDLSHFDTSKVTNMSSMFSSATDLVSLNLSGWNTSNVTAMNSMFNGTRSLESLDLRHFDTSNVTTMMSMFGGTYGGASKLTSLDLSSFDTSKVTDMSNMFLKTTALKYLDMSNAVFTSVTSSSNMFADSGLISGGEIIVGSETARTFINGRYPKPAATITVAD
ncbi:MAG: BspA family leucine-rich repeat surface protein [Oscillospiraceae bacterium]|nr:BspA family leucine-rich repeat surface protein [Oscillospiraceae bacterium]